MPVIQKENIKIAGHVGTWYEIDRRTDDGKELILVESEQFGNDVEWLIIDESGKLVLDDAWNGWLDYEEFKREAQA